MRKILIFPLILLIISACNDAGCLDNRVSLAIVKFYDKNNLTKSLSIDSISIYGIDQPTDSLLLDSVRNVEQLNLPLRPDKDSTQFVIVYNWKANIEQQYNDTLTVYYDSYPYFASLECGCMYNFAIDSVHFTYHLFDSIAVVKPLIDNVSSENIQLFIPVQ